MKLKKMSKDKQQIWGLNEDNIVEDLGNVNIALDVSSSDDSTNIK